ncbi:glycoside hydrolase [Zopfochytrium polystomum]|nr:glycoside hydrolase [Zopfochytrium polystomum]
MTCRTTKGQGTQPLAVAVAVAVAIAIAIAALACIHPVGVAAADPDAHLVASNVANASASSLYWGTYRPNVYFGTKTRSENPVLTGLMWHGALEISNFDKFRHTCEHGDSFATYGWKRHDGRTFGSQTLVDPENNLVLKTDFLKHGEKGARGGWTARISGESLAGEETAEPAAITLYYYVALEGEGAMILNSRLSDEGVEDPVIFRGASPDIADFTVRFTEVAAPNLELPEPGKSPVKLANPSKPQFASFAVPPEQIWQVKDIVRSNVGLSAQAIANKMRPLPPVPFLLSLKDEGDKKGNLLVFQRHVQAPFVFDITFSTGESSEDPAAYTGSALTEKLEAAAKAFDSRFEETFRLAEKGYSSDEVAFAASMLSNMVGGIGHFHGSKIVDRAFEDVVEVEPIDFAPGIGGADSGDEDDYFNDEEDAKRVGPAPQLEGPSTLFTAVPSRPFFPRGFIWDEGFHQLLIGTWDNDLSLTSISSWLDQMDSNGWIAREQILGPEAASKVPQEFQTQYSHFGNPPTLLFSLAKFVERLNSAEHTATVDAGAAAALKVASLTDWSSLSSVHLQNPELARLTLKKLYGRFKKQYSWFRRTQWGMVDEYGRAELTDSKEGYRWRGRTDTHTLTSGLDDYPRSSPAHPGELHVDLLSWVGMMAKSLSSIAEVLGESEDKAKFDRHLRNVQKSLNDLHWNQEAGAFSDLTVNARGESEQVTHIGYLSLFPYVLGLVPDDSPKVADFLRIVSSDAHLWTPFGLRSLSRSDPFHGTAENYWRGPVWINVNFLVLRYLDHLRKTPGAYAKDAADVYQKLRANVVGNVYKEYKRTGFVWEQYSGETGEGRRSHPFTGWTALVTLIMSEKY